MPCKLPAVPSLRTYGFVVNTPLGTFFLLHCLPLYHSDAAGHAKCQSNQDYHGSAWNTGHILFPMGKGRGCTRGCRWLHGEG